MRLYFIVFFEIVSFACKSSLSSLLTVQGYKILVLWYHWCPNHSCCNRSNNHVNNKLCTMINNKIDRNAFINNVECDINHTNSLKHLLNNTEDEYDIIPLSTYTDVNTLAERMSANNNTLSNLSLNAQSINANFDELKITIDQLNEIHTVSVIFIQESWFDCNANIDLYRLNNYNLISKGKYVSEHGGLLNYLHVDFEYDILEDVIGHTTRWEQLFLKIRHKGPNLKKIHY